MARGWNVLEMQDIGGGRNKGEDREGPERVPRWNSEDRRVSEWEWRVGRGLHDETDFRLDEGRNRASVHKKSRALVGRPAEEHPQAARR